MSDVSLAAPHQFTAQELWELINHLVDTGELGDRGENSTWVDGDVNFQDLADALNARRS